MNLRCLLLAALSLGAAPDSNEGTICSVRSPWRFHYTFRPAESYDPKTDKLTPMPTRYGALNTVRSINPVQTPEPPADWTAAEFDDSGWPVDRAPMPWLPEMDQDGSGPYCCFLIRKAAGRTRFIGPPKARVRRLRLAMRFHGGVLVTVNGKTVGQANLPKSGVLEGRGFAEPYPAEAYLSPKGQWWGPGMVYQRWSAKDPDTLAVIDRIDGLRRRTLTIDIPPSVLVSGVNVLAIENRLAPPLEVPIRNRGAVSPNIDKMPHIGISELSLTSDPPGSAAAASRPDGIQAWAHDIHQ